jgi:molybdopterin molybdotransferase
MKSSYTRKNADRQAIVPVRINQDGEIEALPFHGSAHINAIPEADALLEIPAGTTTIEEGEMIYVRPV